MRNKFFEGHGRPTELLIFETSESLMAKDNNDNIKIPEVLVGIIKAVENPEKVSEILYSYLYQIKKIFELTSQDIELIKKAQQILKQIREEDSKAIVKKHKVDASASHYNIVDFVEAITPFREEILSELTLENIFDTETLNFQKALGRLTEMMHGGHLLKEEGITPKDGDPRSDKVIYGHTELTDPETLIHFTICHFLERYMTVVLQKHGLEIANHKDWFLNALTDIISLNIAKIKLPGGEIMEKWLTPRKDGGLGWLKVERIKAFRDAYVGREA